MKSFMVYTPSQRVIELKRMRWAGHVARQRKSETYMQSVDGEIQRKETTWKTMRRWEDNIKILNIKKLRKKDRWVWNGLTWLKICTVNRPIP
jgi:hypothetical protein